MQNIICFILDHHFPVEKVHINDGTRLSPEHISKTHCAAISYGCIQISLYRLTGDPKFPRQFLHGCPSVTHRPHFTDVFIGCFSLPASIACVLFFIFCSDFAERGFIVGTKQLYT